MTENTLQFIAFTKIIWLAFFCLLYGSGGISGKWKRRFVGASWMMLGVFVYSKINFNWSYWYLLYLPLLIGSLTLPYGADSFWVKVRKRFLYGLALGIAAAPLAILNTAWVLWGYHIFLCVSASIVFGVFNPFKNARDEETNIARFSQGLILFMI